MQDELNTVYKNHILFLFSITDIYLMSNLFTIPKPTLVDNKNLWQEVLKRIKSKILFFLEILELHTANKKY